MEECKRCKSQFEPKPKYKNYCSDKCKFPSVWTEDEKEAIRQRTIEAIRASGVIPIVDRKYECKQCGRGYVPKWLPSTFCSRSCSSKHRFSTTEARQAQAHKASKWASIHCKPKRPSIPKVGKERSIVRIREKKVRQGVCTSCGCVFAPKGWSAQHCNDCKGFHQYKRLFLKLGLTGSNVCVNSELAKEKLVDMYHTRKMSMLDIQRDYKINVNTLHRFGKRMNFKMRTLSEGSRVGYAEGRITPNEHSHSTFKQGWHTTWDGKQVYYRSSYEYDLCKELDEKHVPYEMEALRVSYYDSQERQTRTAIPDFHLVDSNEIVEVKSVYFFNKRNMQDKFREYKKLGYECKLVLEHKEYDYEAVMSL